MEIDLKDINGVAVVSIVGELDALSAPELTGFFESRVGETYINLVTDLEGLSYSSSAGIRIFLGLARSFRQKGGDLRIATVRPPVEKIFKLSKFDRIVKIFPSVEDAVKSYDE